MAVRIRMKKFGRKHRPFFRIVAVDGRRPRDGRVLEELGTYDPLVPETDARAILKGDRIDYWIGVGAQPSDKVAVLIKKYGSKKRAAPFADSPRPWRPLRPKKPSRPSNPPPKRDDRAKRRRANRCSNAANDKLGRATAF